MIDTKEKQLNNCEHLVLLHTNKGVYIIYPDVNICAHNKNGGYTSQSYYELLNSITNDSLRYMYINKLLESGIRTKSAGRAKDNYKWYTDRTNFVDTILKIN